MPTGTLATVVSIGGTTLQKSIVKTTDNAAVYGDGSSSISLPAANDVGVTFVNDADGTGSATASGGHDLVTGLADLYWAGGVRYGVTITVATNDVDITDSGAGDTLPASSTQMYIANSVQINTAIDGDLVALIAANATKRSNIAFYDVADNVIAAVELLANEPFTWHDTSGVTNPFTGAPITYAEASNGDSTAASIISVLVLQDSTP